MAQDQVTAFLLVRQWNHIAQKDKTEHKLTLTLFRVMDVSTVLMMAMMSYIKLSLNQLTSIKLFKKTDPQKSLKSP